MNDLSLRKELSKSHPILTLSEKEEKSKT